MKDLGIYYDKTLETVIIGFKTPGKYRDKLIGKVIGYTHDKGYMWNAYNVGYKYDNWTGLTYVGRYTTFTTLKGYMDFLHTATYDQITAYFKVKKVVEERMNSHVVVRRYNGDKWYERHYKSLK